MSKAKILFLTLVSILSLVAFIGCSPSVSETPDTETTSEQPTTQVPQSELPSEGKSQGEPEDEFKPPTGKGPPFRGPIIPPEPRPMSLWASIKQDYLLPGEEVEINIKFTNQTSEPTVVSPFPPEIRIDMPTLPDDETVRHFNGGSQELVLQPEETIEYSLFWDQTDDNGQPVSPGWYNVWVLHSARKASQSTVKDTSWSGGRQLQLLIQFPQGPMEEVIEDKESITVEDLTVTLRRVDLARDGISFWFLATWPSWAPQDFPPQDNPHGDPLEVHYIVDGVIKDTDIYGKSYPEGGVDYVIGYNPVFLDPIPSDAKELILSIGRFGSLEGPWEFHVPLETGLTKFEQSPPIGKIIFRSDRDWYHQIYIMDADGSNQTRLVSNEELDSWPVWSPDGTKIAFVRNQEIYVMNANGSNQTRFTYNATYDESPAWSPDGSKIAFVSFRDGDFEIYLMNSDGTGQVNITNNRYDQYHPTWSPDGRKIAFSSTGLGGHYLYWMDADGSNWEQLTEAGTDTNPSWSPSGRRIAFVSNRDGNHEIYVMNADGTEQTRLTTNYGEDSNPTWSPEGDQIVFASNRGDNKDIYIMDYDGGNQTRITTHSAHEELPSWTTL